MTVAAPPFFLHLTTEPPAGARAWLSNCGRGRASAPGYRFGGDHPQHQGRSIIQLTLAGRGFVRFAGVERPIPPDHALLLQPPGDHVYYARPDQPWHFAFVTLDGPDAAHYLRSCQQRVGPVLALPPGVRPRERLERLLHERLAREAPSDPWQDVQDAYALSVELLQEAARQAGEADLRHDPIRRVCDHLQRHLTEPHALDDLARLAGLSRAHFSRRFRARTGLPPGAWLLRARLERAEHLLAATDDPVRAITAAVGFDDANYFARQFRARNGCSPRCYRLAAARGESLRPSSSLG